MGGRHERGQVDPAGTLPALVELATAALGLLTDRVVTLGGATGRTWACGDHVLRVGGAEDLAREVWAMTAASVAVPVPDVLDLAEFPDEKGRACAGLLLTRLPGRPAMDTDGMSPREARDIGEACGRLHSVLASVGPPAGMSVLGHGEVCTIDATVERRLLHLDLHPLNVLVKDGSVSGVIDWANAAIGPPVLDRARSWSVMTLDPAALPMHQDPRFTALLDGWSSVAGWPDLPAAARAWACEYLLDDLDGRYPADRLEHVRAELALARTVD